MHKTCPLQASYRTLQEVDRTSASARLYQHPIDNMSKNKPSISMICVACYSNNNNNNNIVIWYYSKLGSRVWSPPYQGNEVAIGHAVMHYARAAHTFSVGIKCQHCRYIWRCPNVYSASHRLKSFSSTYM